MPQEKLNKAGKRGKRNRLAGKGKNKRSGSNLATGRDYSKPYEKKSKADYKKKAKDNTQKRREGTYGKIASKGKDLSHRADGTTFYEDASKNRARNGSGKNPKKAPALKSKASKTTKRKTKK